MGARLTQPDAGPEGRLYGMMQALIAAAQTGTLEPAPDRGIVTASDALNAILQLAAVIDNATQAGRIQTEEAQRAAAMLMIVHDYIRPLPPGVGAEGGPDLITPDLEAFVGELRRRHGASGNQG